jgi:hypothetical protein
VQPNAPAVASLTALADGRVMAFLDPPLLAFGPPLPVSAQIFDPATLSWTMAATVPDGRYEVEPVLLADGTLLAIGGMLVADNAVTTYVPDADIYDPATDTWSDAGAMNIVRDEVAATVMSDGRVLVAGGQLYPNGSAAVEIYDPTANTWTQVASMSVTRINPGLALLDDGRVLAAGGYATPLNGPRTTAEIYDPATDTWSATASMARGRFGPGDPAMRLLADGRVMAAYGVTDWPLFADLVEFYDPSTATWTSATGAPPRTTASRPDAALVLPDGNVLLSGINGSHTRERVVYDPVADNTSTMCGPFAFNTGFRYAAAGGTLVAAASAGTEVLRDGTEYPDADGDCVTEFGSLDNCATAFNPGQENTDGEPYRNRSGSFDVTVVHADVAADACDDDDDNDGLPDAVELALPGPECPSATGPLDPLDPDHDNDFVTDGAECIIGTDPRLGMLLAPTPGDADRDKLPDSVETTIGTDPLVGDTDGDGMLDGIEFKYHRGNPLDSDTDDDGCSDGKEAASVNSDHEVNVLDLQIVAAYPGRNPGQYEVNFDHDRNLTIDVIDLLFVARQQGVC